MTDSITIVSFGDMNKINPIPINNVKMPRSNSASMKVTASWICDKSLVKRLDNSPTRRCAKKSIDRRINFW